METESEPIRQHVARLARQSAARPMASKTVHTGSLVTAKADIDRVAKLLSVTPAAAQQAEAFAAAPLGQIDMNWAPITFDGGVPVGGFSHVTLFPDGRAVFTGHFHDSGAPSYNVALTFAIISKRGAVFTLSHTGTMHGTFDPGSRDDDWTAGSQHNELAAVWGELSEGYTWTARAGVNWTLASTVESAVDAVKAAAGIVGPVVSLIALI